MKKLMSCGLLIVEILTLLIFLNVKKVLSSSYESLFLDILYACLFVFVLLLYPILLYTKKIKEVLVFQDRKSVV